jgi:putative tricarboxylic transport membrane protein
MDIFQALINVLSPLTFLAMSVGVAWGIVCGALPGLGATIGIALLIPLTFGMSPLVALPMLAGVYAGAIYGGGITAVLLGVPGTSADAATVYDGHPLAQKGLANKGLTASVSASAFGGIFSALVLLFLAPPLARASLAFGPPEYFLIAIFGLTIIAALSSTSIIKGIMAGFLGLLLGTIGIDPITGDMRFTFGAVYLYDGFPLIPLILGLFAFPRCMVLIEDLILKGTGQISLSSEDGGGPKLTFREIWDMKRTYLRSAVLGTLIGILPGAGANIACFVGYAAAKRASKTPEKFGTGIPEGVAASEAANNGVCNGSLVPLLTLSIPGSPTAAVILGALMIHGLVPGAELFTKHAEITYTFIVSAAFCNVIMLAMGWYGSRWFGKIVQIPTYLLAPSMLLISLVGAFTVRQYIFDIGVTIGIGTVAYFMTRSGFPMASILLGAILGPMAEGGFRRAMLMNQGDLTIFFTRPISLTLIILTILSLYAGLRMQRRNRQLEKRLETATTDKPGNA